MSDRQLPRVFIGSSVEGLSYARAISDNLYHNANAFVWEHCFRPSRYTLDEIKEQLDQSDFAVFIHTADDLVKVRKDIQGAVRDNVILETGMFIGKLGKERVFIVQPEKLPDELKDDGATSLRLASDFNGLTLLKYRSPVDGNYHQAVSRATNNINQEFTRQGLFNKNETQLEMKIDQLHGILEEKEAELKKKLQQLELMERQLAFLHSVKDTPALDDSHLKRILSSYEKQFYFFPEFLCRGTTMYRRDNECMSPICYNGDEIGKTGLKPFSLHYEKEGSGIGVIEAHKTGETHFIAQDEDPLRYKKRKFLVCSPFGKDYEYVISFHLSVSSNFSTQDLVTNFLIMHTINSQLTYTLNSLLKGEL